MNTANDDDANTYRAEVDQQDGGPASHPGDDGGETNDVASGGVSELRNEDDDRSPDTEDEPEKDVHGDTDTVS